MGACTNSNFAAQFRLPGTYAPTASYSLLSNAVKAAEQKGRLIMSAMYFPAIPFMTAAALLQNGRK